MKIDYSIKVKADIGLENAGDPNSIPILQTTLEIVINAGNPHEALADAVDFLQGSIKAISINIQEFTVKECMSNEY